MDKEKELRARRVIVNVLSREHKSMIERRSRAAVELAVEQTRLEARKAQYERECREAGGCLGPGASWYNEERSIERAKKDAETAEANATATAEAMEYVTLFFLDQLEKAEQKA